MSLKKLSIKIFTLFMVLAATDVIAQDVVKKLTFSSCQSTIIRKISNTRDLVCNSGICPDNPSFVYADDTTSNQYVMFLDMDTIWDFEIFKDTVYFCGSKSTRAPGHAIFGYFPVGGFPFVPIKYVSLPTMKRAVNIEVDTMAGRTHAIIVGPGINNRAYLVDAIRLSSTWGVYMAEFNVDGMFFNDIAFTDNFIAITSTVAPYLLANGRLWKIDKPTGYGMPIFPGNIHYADVNYLIGGKYLVRHISKNHIATATPSGANLSGTKTFHVERLALSTSSPYIAVKSSWYYTENADNSYLEDIRFLAKDSVLEMAIYTDYKNGLCRSTIFNIFPPITTPVTTSTVYCHTYDNVRINSLDYSSYNYFVAMGFDYSLGNYMWHFKYKFNSWWSCLHKAPYTQYPYEDGVIAKKMVLDYIYFEEVPQQMEKYEKETEYHLECFSPSKETDEFNH